MKLFVGNLAYTATEDDLRDLFTPFGAVTDVFIVEDRETGRPRGFAFVTLENADSGREAIKNLNGTDYGGRTLKVDEAMQRPAFQGGGSGGGGGGGGGGRGGDRDRRPRGGGNNRY